MKAEQLKEFFPQFTPEQIGLFEKLVELYPRWNEQINVISRKDIDNLVERHILHSLSLLYFINIKPGSIVLDLGTGGGLPGIPLAIALPDVKFVLADSTGKKIKVVNEIIEELGIQNAIGIHSRAEDLRQKFDYVLARGVTTIDKLLNWTRRLVSGKQINLFPNGLITYKGGNINPELSLLSKKDYYEVFPVKNKIHSEMLEDKYIIYVQA